MNKKTSLKDIAQKLGVSTALVSYVLNNQEEKIGAGKETAAKIRAMAKELNYQTHQTAKSLKTGRTNTIGLIVADIANPFFSSLARIIEDEAEKKNYTVIFTSSDESIQKQEHLIEVLKSRQVDGLIIAPTDNSELQISQLIENNIPFVLVDRYFPEINTSYISLDNYAAAHRAVSHLIEMGNKNIGMITYKRSLFNLQERKRGFLDAIKDHNMPINSHNIKEVAYEKKEDIATMIDALLAQEVPVDALFFAANELALEGLKHIKSIGLMVPEDLAIVCFDQSEVYDFFYSPITYVKQPLTSLGKGAFQMLLAQLSGSTSFIQENLDPELIIQTSSGKYLQKARLE